MTTLKDARRSALSFCDQNKFTTKVDPGTCSKRLENIQNTYDFLSKSSIGRTKSISSNSQQFYLLFFLARPRLPSRRLRYTPNKASRCHLSCYCLSRSEKKKSQGVSYRFVVVYDLYCNLFHGLVLFFLIDFSSEFLPIGMCVRRDPFFPSRVLL